MRARDVVLILWGLAASTCLPAAGQTADRELSLTVGESAVIDFDFDVGQISTSTPEVVDTVALSRREVLLLAKGHGVSTVGVWSRDGRRSFYKVSVAYDLGQVRDLLHRTFPEEAIEVHSARDAVSLTGRVSGQAVADRAAALVGPLAKSVVNNLEVTPPAPDKQIMLRVKFAELNRSATASFGINFLSTGALNTSGRVTTGQFSPPNPTSLYPLGTMADGLTGVTPGSSGGQVSNFSLTDALNIFAFRPDLNLAAMIQALRSQGVLQILAEPNLVTTDNKEASFLVGGEFPVPMVQGGANVGAVTVTFREFGIRLAFLPRITSHGTIKMHVKPEVSAIDIANGVVVSGFTIPALATRRMETDIELAEGQSFVIAGLMDDRVTETMSKVPGLAKIPVLGALFKSRQESKSKTELVVIVTPVITDPATSMRLSPEPVMPMTPLPSLGAPAAGGAGRK